MDFDFNVLDKMDNQSWFTNFKPSDWDSNPLIPELRNLSEEQINDQFKEIYDTDSDLRDVIGEFVENYSVQEKLSVLQAYKKAENSVLGLIAIMDDDDDDETRLILERLRNKKAEQAKSNEK